MKPMMRQRNEPGTWSPFQELHRLRREINRIFESNDWPGRSLRAADWMPAVDVSQDHEKITVQAETPGFRREDINVSIHADILTISGERRQERNAPSEEPFQSERFFGRFQREVQLPEPVDPERAEATYKDGVLCIYLPKTEQSKRKQIEVKPSA